MSDNRLQMPKLAAEPSPKKEATKTEQAPQAEEDQPIEEVQLTEDVQPTEEDQPIEDAQPTEEVQLTEDAQPREEDQLTEDAQPKILVNGQPDQPDQTQPAPTFGAREMPHTINPTSYPQPPVIFLPKNINRCLTKPKTNNSQ